MSKSRARPADREPRSILLWWAALGLGIGLVLLSALLWLERDPEAGRAEALVQDLHRLEPMLARLKQGETPDAAMLAQSKDTALAPLVVALADAHRQRQQALRAYQAQIESVGLGDWLTPENLASADGRQRIRQRLVQLEVALEALMRQDGDVQSRLDESVARWLQDSPSQWGSEPWRRDLLAASAGAAQVMSRFFGVERDLVARVRDLLTHLDGIADSVALENGEQQELVFAREADLERYRDTLMKLGELGRREADLLAQAQQVGGQHARRVGDLLLASRAQNP